MSELRRTVLLAALGLAVWAASAAAQEEGVSHVFSLDSRYMLQTYSNEAVAEFGIEVLDLASFPAEAIASGGRLRNIGRGLAVLVGSTIVGQAFGLSYHEFGHGTRAAAAGLRPRYGFGTLATDADIQAALQRPPEHQSFFGYFLGSLSKGSGYTLATPDDVLFPPLSETELVDSGWALLLASGGLNNEMLFAERIEDEVYRGGGHAGLFNNYVNGKLSASQYSLGGPFGDVGNAVTLYAGMGHTVTLDDIDSASKASLLLSSMSYQLIYQTIQVFMGRPIHFDAWAPGGVELPNTSFFMTRSGLSFRVRTGYRRGAWRFPLAVERVFKGTSRTEASVGGEWTRATLRLRANATVGRQLGLSLSADRDLSERFVVSGGYALRDSRNLLGERLTPSLEGGARYHDLFVRVGVTY